MSSDHLTFKRTLFIETFLEILAPYPFEHEFGSRSFKAENALKPTTICMYAPILREHDLFFYLDIRTQNRIFFWKDEKTNLYLAFVCCICQFSKQHLILVSERFIYFHSFHLDYSDDAL